MQSVGNGRGSSQRNTSVAAAAPSSCARMNAATSSGRIPAKVLLAARASVTAGLRMPAALGLDGFDGGRDQVVGDVGARDPLTNECFTFVLWLNPRVYKPGVVQHPFEVV